MVEQPTPRRATGGPQAGHAYLDVPFAEKDKAKALGARWDPQARRWYDPRPPTTGLDQWATRSDVPDLLPGEDREFGSGLFVDMIPRSCWFTNVRTCVSPQDWERLARMIYRRAGDRCEVCGAPLDRAAGRRLEAHERWHFDDATGVQALRRLICLCNDCHLSTHLGFANVTGRADQALAHLRAVTGMTHAETSRRVQDAGDLWTARSRRVWTLDLIMLTDAGVTLARPESAARRRAVADRALHHAQPVVPASIPVSQSTLKDRPAPPDTPSAPPSPRRGLWSWLAGRPE